MANSAFQKGALDTHLVVDVGEQPEAASGAEDFNTKIVDTPSAGTVKHENGRTYHKFEDDAYFLPNDDIESQRLDLQHLTWKIALDGALSRVPATSGTRLVLDVGTGTGIWATEYAESHAEAEVTATDLSAIQPKTTPPNCTFIIANAEHDWTFRHNFDYIHSRMLTLGMHDWPRFFQQAWAHLEPGGWIETSETQFPPRRADGEEPRNSKFLQWGEYVYEAAASAGIDARASEKFDEQLVKQGFINVERVNLQWPVRPWAKGEKYKQMGKLLYRNTLDAVPGIAMALFTRQLGWKKEQVDDFCKEAIADVQDQSNYYYYPMVLHRAQKPET